MFKSKHILNKVVCALGVTAILAGMPVLGYAWEPQKPVEFVVMAGKGGGADKAVRFIQSIIASEKLASVPFTPVNKPGGSGAKRWYT
jgi:tripartite-type tricarboxylate transporter receptor subunit TctC